MTAVRIAVIGYGNVGAAIATAVARAGHHVVFATTPDRPDGAAAAIARHEELASVTVAPIGDAVAGADLVVLAVPFAALDELLPPLATALDGTVVVDATNPIGPGLTHGLGSARSGAEHVADLVPAAHVVKAFNVYGYENLSTPPSGPDGLLPLMPIAGDDPAATSTVATLLTELGWEPLVVGPLAAAVDLEHMTLVWVRLVRMHGSPPRLVWAALRDADPTTGGSSA